MTVARTQSPKALAERVAAQWNAGHIDDAVALLEAAHAGSTDDRFVGDLACAWVERAVASGEGFEAAREQLRTLLAEDTRRMVVYAELALSYVREPGPGRNRRLHLAQAVIASAHAVEGAPRSAALEHAAGVVAYVRGDVVQARASFAEAIAIDPSSPEANLGVAIVARGLLDHARAAAAFERALEHAPQQYEIEANLLWAHSLAESGDPNGALAVLTAAVRRDDDTRIWYALGRIDVDYVEPSCWTKKCPDDLRPGLTAIQSFERAMASPNAAQYPDLVAASESSLYRLGAFVEEERRDLERKRAEIEAAARVDEASERERLRALEEQWQRDAR